MRRRWLRHRITREQIVAQIRNPLYSWSQRVKFLNYGKCDSAIHCDASIC